MEEKFKLKKLTLETLGVSCQYEIQTSKDNGLIETAVYQKKDSRPPHLDLIKLFQTGLAQKVSQILHFDKIPDFRYTAIVPVSVKFSGKGDEIGVVISGYIATGVGRLTFKTPKIKYLSGTTDFHAELTVLMHDIENEIQKYLFDGKEAVVEEFGND